MDLDKFPDALCNARAAGTDAANRSMRRAGRKFWNDDDLAAALEASDSVLTALGFEDFVEGQTDRAADRLLAEHIT